MRVLAFFLNDYDCQELLRGSERRFFEISPYLKRLGVQIFALEYESFHSEKLGPHGHIPLKVKRRFPNNGILSLLNAIRNGFVACVKHHYDIVYVPCHLARPEGLEVGLVAPYVTSRLCRKPLLIVLHHITPKERQTRNPVRLRAYHAATFLAVSQTTANEFQKLFPTAHVVTVGNGINLERFKTNKQLSRKEYDAVFVGRIAENKGIFDLLNAWKHVKTKIPSARLLLVGGVDWALKDTLFKAIGELQLKDNVTVAGFVSDERLVQLLVASKIFVFPSHVEGFGLAVAEAMAAGLPCIISDIPALREVYSSAALFVKPSDSASLAQAVLFLLSNPEKRSELQAKGQRLAKHFSWEEVAKKELEVMKAATKK
jgi:glycosyltransferase involved in cell wall biosynthesis